MFTSQAPGFIAASSSAPIIALVSPVDGAARMTQSNSESRARQRSVVSVSSRPDRVTPVTATRSEEHTSELQSLMRISYAVFCLKKKNTLNLKTNKTTTQKSKHTHTNRRKKS